MSGRDPFPSPKFENDVTLSGFRPPQLERLSLNRGEGLRHPSDTYSLKFNHHSHLDSCDPTQPKRKYDKPTHIAQTEEPWSHLHNTSTLASTQRSVPHSEHGAPRDSLDFQMKSVYDHSKDFFWTKSQMLFQKETVSEAQSKLKQEMQEKEQEKDTTVWVGPQRCSIYSIK